MKYLLILLLLALHGCTFYNVQKEEKDKFFQDSGDPIVKAVFESGSTIDFNELYPAHYYFFENAIAGFTADSGFQYIPLEQIDMIQSGKLKMKVDDFLQKDTTLVNAVTSKTGKVYLFGNLRGGGRYFKGVNSIIAGVDSLNAFRIAGTDSLSYVMVQNYNEGKSCTRTLCVGGIAVGIFVAIIAATKESCPFIYSYDGQNYVFDKEPLGGATMPILQRTEFSKLKYLKASNGEYKLLVTNEVDETQHIDKMNLTYIDHNAGETIYPDEVNRLYSINDETVPLSVTDENNKDLKNFFSKDDDIFWQSSMKSDQMDKTRNTIYLNYKKPAGAVNGSLIINAGTTLWGSNMIKEMLMLYGKNIDDYYEKMNEGKEDYQQVMDFLEREELFQLKLYAFEKGKWEYKRTINGSGPFKTETRIYTFDIKGIEGDTLKLKIEPPAGFWSFDYAAMNYDAVPVKEVKTIALKTAADQNKADIIQSLNTDDHNYFSLPDREHYCYLSFDAPEVPAGKVRTIFASTSGWYDIHLPREGFTDMLKLWEISKPGAIVTYSNKLYQKWAEKLKAQK